MHLEEDQKSDVAAYELCRPGHGPLGRELPLHAGGLYRLYSCHFEPRTPDQRTARLVP